MEFLKNLKLNNWWSLLVYIGFFGIIGSLFIKTDFVDSKNIFGVSLGFLFIGLSTLSAIKTAIKFKEANAYTGGPAILCWPIIKHNFFSGLITLIGATLAVIFGTRTIVSLFW
ncbi:MAG TPA: hypothetical protein PKG74_00225 [Candidatus Colwellbacteria bacterium]|nr:hypothetical protein [Candidatus Colwellbacteria bacterium]